jgi:hypothetical protein
MCPIVLTSYAQKCQLSGQTLNSSTGLPIEDVHITVVDQDDVRIVVCSAEPDTENEAITISIDYNGNHSVSGGSFTWQFLDNQTNLFTALPRNYIGRELIE